MAENEASATVDVADSITPPAGQQDRRALLSKLSKTLGVASAALVVGGIIAPALAGPSCSCSADCPSSCNCRTVGVR